MKNIKSIFFLLLITIITIYLWLISKSSLNEIIINPLKSITQITALIGCVYLSFELVLISRLKILEKILGPLDLIYNYHRLLSSFSLIALILHASSLMFSSVISEFPTYVYVIPKLNNLPYAAGIVALYILITTTIISLYTKLPYHIWKLTHRLLAFSVIIAGYHILTINSDISTSIFLRIWILGVLAMGILSMIYKVILYSYVSSRREYLVFEKQIIDKVVVLTLKPIDKKLLFKPGQFAYFKFFCNEISDEEHPFSIMSSPEEDYIKIGVKALGDYTKKIKDIPIGSRVIVRGGFGGFSVNYGEYKKEIWIGAGIGITPILGLVPYTQTNIIYCTKNNQDAVFNNMLINKTNNNAVRVTYENFQSEAKGHFKPEYLNSLMTNPELTCVRICGPNSMLESFKKYFKEKNLPKDNLIYEDFNFLN